MSLFLAISVVVVFDALLIGALVWVMALPRKLTPHRPRPQARAPRRPVRRRVAAARRRDPATRP